MELIRVILFHMNILLYLHNTWAHKSMFAIDSGIRADACDNNLCQMEGLSGVLTTLDVIGTKEYQNNADGSVQFSSKINITQSKPTTNCTAITDTQGLSSWELLEMMTAACRYDRLVRPRALVNGTISDDPLDIFIRLDISVSDKDSSSTQLETDGLLQIRYIDPRLAYAEFAPQRQTIVILREEIGQFMWVPHIYFTTEGQSLPLTQTQKVIMTTISPEGSVVISTHLTTKLSCRLQLQKFPFDELHCGMLIESWLNNASEVNLAWDENKPLAMDPGTGLMEFVLEYSWSNKSLLVSNIANIITDNNSKLYSALNYVIFLRRQSGYYIINYFLPSMMIVAISWVSFWLQADQTPARTTLGTTTLLSFITLGQSVEKNIPKVNYIKISEIWFFVCIAFIFCSLVEFAFVNTIWRRKNNVAMKRISSRQILKKTVTPQNNRQLNAKMRKIKSVSSMISISGAGAAAGAGASGNGSDNERFSYVSNVAESPYPTASTEHTDNPFTFNIDANIINNNNNSSNHNLNNLSDAETNRNQTFSTMTPHEVSLWIDRKARFAFPLAFIIFNAIFWTLAMLGQ